MSTKKTAVVFGISGMDACELSRILLEKNYKVYGVTRQSSSRSFWRLKEAGIFDKIEYLQGDLTDQTSINHIVSSIKPDEFYNLAAISFVGASWTTPVLMMEVTGIGPIRIMEAIKDYSPKTRFYQASSSECMGIVKAIPQDLNTPFNPASIYGAAKCSAHYACNIYRRSYNIYAVGGVLYNHTGIYRGEEFVERKITLGVARIKEGKQSELKLGNLAAKRDYGHSRDYMTAAWLMMQQPTPKDYLIGSGKTYSIEDVCKLAFECAGLDYKKYVIQDPKFFRPSEVDILLADPSEAKKELGWSPTYTFEDLIKEMVEADLDRVRKGIL